MTAGEKILELRRKALRQQLVVLVWGPGDPGEDGAEEARRYWDKRNQIRRAVSSACPQAEVLFSESDALRDYTRDLQDLLLEELVHAVVADCIIVLDVSRGAHVEVDRLTAVPEIASKITVLIPERYLGSTGLATEVYRGLKVVGFSEAELRDCSVATSKSISIVTRAALKKMLMGSSMAV